MWRLYFYKVLDIFSYSERKSYVYFHTENVDISSHKAVAKSLVWFFEGWKWPHHSYHHTARHHQTKGEVFDALCPFLSLIPCCANVCISWWSSGGLTNRLKANEKQKLMLYDWLFPLELSINFKGNSIISHIIFIKNS